MFDYQFCLQDEQTCSFLEQMRPNRRIQSMPNSGYNRLNPNQKLAHKTYVKKLITELANLQPVARTSLKLK